MVFVTGDTHGDFGRFAQKKLTAITGTTKKDIVIILGDFGGVWNDCKEESYWLDWLNDKPFTTCFVDGNHENYDRLYGDEFESVDFHGGKAHKIRDNIYHLMRGYIFNFEDKKFFCMGGASSHDIDDGILDPDDFECYEDFQKVYRSWWRKNKIFRVNHVSWWKQELPNDTEMQRGIESLTSVDWTVDFVISHCLPASAALKFGFSEKDSLTEYFDTLLDKGLKFNKWYCGHYHFQELSSKYNILYHTILRIL